ncbi:phytoene/squalene synthase family protein [Sulfitobacter donghicola]|uniref:Phytoene synthase n=1 Tax=Sulfitobacter donghicola DSW-25 = KCTC 12864 = JCM 14565 TaxID=1300350 RepID=A0A073IJ82_9RHOB|nr:squalene/phytoene synthase family protein [Sulfitobacter donghicola]KEJ89541.1 phytoene synthase [Sulfitobacter donghicola DSW-25 = KCTC 12864 = JCM 14565]KIN69366.1 Phytoene/squalene synthetase [Sulfitobacter donghicola DSW-25 = KCTC 12864 = JCM 14565]
MNWNDDLNACAKIVERGDPLRFRTAMMAPVAQRGALFALYAFNVEVSRAPWVTSEPMIAEMRLQWWRDVLEEIAEGSPVRRHEVATPLAQAISPDQAKQLDDLVAARRWDVYRDPFEDAADLTRYITQTAGNLMQVSANLLGQADDVPLRDAGFAAGIGAWLRAIPALEEAGRIPLLDGTPQGVATLAQEGLGGLIKARKSRSAVSRSCTPALLQATAAEPALRHAIAQPQSVVEGALPETGLAFTLRAATGRW